MTHRPAVVRVYWSPEGWRWNLVSANGVSLAVSPRAYTERWRARRAAREMAAPPIVLGYGKERETLRT